MVVKSHLLFLALLGCMVLAPQWGRSQAAYLLQVVMTDLTEPQAAGLREKLPEHFPDSLSILNAVQDLVLELHGRAYLEASVDTLLRVGHRYTAFVHVGRPYRWAVLSNGNVDPVFLDKVGYRERLYDDRPFSYSQVKKLQEALLEYAENNGYPFARVSLANVTIANEQFRAQLRLDKGPLITIERIELVGDLRLNPAYLSRYLGIRSGDLYSRERVLRVRDRLRELSFVQLQGDPLVSFRGDRAVLQLRLGNRPASRFDFLIGVLPNSSQSGRLLITGDFTGEMYNQFGAGERIFAAFEQLRPQTQRLDLQFSYPYLLDLPFGPDLNFNLYKRDTTYLDLGFEAGLQYFLSGRDYLKVFSSTAASTLLNVDTARIRRTGQLPDTLDVRRSSFGLAYYHEQLDYRFNPRKGWAVFLQAGAGLKRLPRNNLIRELDIADPYGGLPERSFQYRVEGRLETYWPLFQQSTVKLALQGGYLISDLAVLANEQFRIGGARLLRGFDEEFIFATNYTVATLEYRLLIGQNAYLYTFGDLGRVDNRTIRTPAGAATINFPYGLGAGITFETAVGLFGINLAFGADRRTKVDLGAPKVHFGYVSRF